MKTMIRKEGNKYVPICNMKKMHKKIEEIKPNERNSLEK